MSRVELPEDFIDDQISLEDRVRRLERALSITHDGLSTTDADLDSRLAVIEADLTGVQEWLYTDGGSGVSRGLANFLNWTNILRGDGSLMSLFISAAQGEVWEVTGTTLVEADSANWTRLHARLVAGTGDGTGITAGYQTCVVQSHNAQQDAGWQTARVSGILSFVTGAANRYVWLQGAGFGGFGGMYHSASQYQRLWARRLA